MGKQRKRKREATAEARAAEPRPARPPGGGTAWWSWRRDGPLAALVLVVALAAFGNAVGNDFVFDDLDVIRDNPRVASVDLATIASTPYWTGDQAEATGLYRPLTILSFALERAAFGPGPRPVHATNVVLNALAAVLAFALALRLSGSRFAGVAAGLLWGVHPVHVEAVANGVGRSEILAALAVFGGVLAQLAWAAEGAPPRRGRLLAGALACTFGGLLAKESAVTLPGLAFLADWLVRERGRLAPTLRRLGGYLAHAIPLGAYLLIRGAVVGSRLPAVQEVMGRTTGFQRVLYASETLLRQLGQSLAPVWLCGEYADYRHLVDPHLSDPMVLLSLAAWAAAAAVLVALVRRGWPELALGPLWFLLALLPVSNLLFPIGTVRADRLLYVPSFGIALLVALLLGRLALRARAAAAAALVVAVAALAARTWAGNREWASLDAFWDATLAENPGSPIAWAHAGEAARRTGDNARAEQCFRKAIELRDGAGYFHAAAHTNLGELLALRGDLAGAEQQYRLTLSRDARHYVALLNLGELLLRAPTSPDRVHEAAGLLARAVDVKPGDFRCWANLAQAQEAEGTLPAALASAQRARGLRPDIPDLWAAEAEILQALGRTDEAAAALGEYRQRSGK